MIYGLFIKKAKKNKKKRNCPDSFTKFNLNKQWLLKPDRPLYLTDQMKT